ncbi:hypothetical protein Lalb_Chr19g0125091 [Lupinus albus]|uniref:Uncharacterized protein n=1 Tax=Lupinus albus TaxID=3870 RepID=A0A6A4NW75_LUPAL|nr:hypothetical protein Lalb_Chr19g0125091 [Lupinus albus]
MRCLRRLSLQYVEDLHHKTQLFINYFSIVEDLYKFKMTYRLCSTLLVYCLVSLYKFNVPL